jgi:hypothetical protein
MSQCGLLTYCQYACTIELLMKKVYNLFGPILAIIILLFLLTSSFIIILIALRPNIQTQFAISLSNIFYSAFLVALLASTFYVLKGLYLIKQKNKSTNKGKQLLIRGIAGIITAILFDFIVQFLANFFINFYGIAKIP